MWGISILADLDLRGIIFHAVVVIGLGKDLLFKIVLGHCVLERICPIPMILIGIVSINLPKNGWVQSQRPHTFRRPCIDARSLKGFCTPP